MIIFRNKNYKNFSEICKDFKISPETLRGIRIRCEENSTSFTESLEDFLYERKQINNLIQLVNEKYNASVSSRVELTSFLKKMKIKQPPPGISAVVWSQIVFYSIKYDYTWLVFSENNFYYKDLLYSSYVKFVYHYKIITKNLVEEIINNQGDLHKAILKCENDPEFGLIDEVIINNVKYLSVSEASRHLNISSRKLKHLRREGLTYQEAYEQLIANKESYISRLVVKFPISNGKLTFNSVEELSDYLGYATSTTRRLMQGLTEEQVLNLPKKNSTLYVIDGKEFSSVSEIEKSLGLGSHAIRNTATSLGLTLEEFMDKINDYTLCYEGKKYFTIYALNKDIDLHKLIISNAFKSVSNIENIEERSKAFEEFINEYRKRDSFLLFRGRKYANIHEMSKDLKIGYYTIEKNISNSNSVKEFQEWLEEYLRNR